MDTSVYLDCSVITTGHQKPAVRRPVDRPEKRAGSREQGAGSREQGAGERPVGIRLRSDNSPDPICVLGEGGNKLGAVDNPGLKSKVGCCFILRAPISP